MCIRDRLKPDWEKGTILNWEITSNMGNPFIDVQKNVPNSEIKLLLTRPYYPELDGPFLITFKISILKMHTTKDLDVTYEQTFPGNHISEEGVDILDNIGTIPAPSGNYYLDRVVNFGRRCCYNTDFVGPVKFILDFGENYVSGSQFRIDYRFFNQYKAYKSRYVQLICSFGSEYEDLYIDTTCYLTSKNQIVARVPTGMNLVKGHRIPFTIQFMGEMIGMAGVLAFPLNRYAIVYPLTKAGYAGVFTAQTQ